MFGKVLKWVLVGIGALGVMSALAGIVGVMFWTERSSIVRLFTGSAALDPSGHVRVSLRHAKGRAVVMFDAAKASDSRSGWRAVFTDADQGPEQSFTVARSVRNTLGSYTLSFEDDCAAGQTPTKQIAQFPASGPRKDESRHETCDPAKINFSDLWSRGTPVQMVEDVVSFDTGATELAQIRELPGVRVLRAPQIVTHPHTRTLLLQPIWSVDPNWHDTGAADVIAAFQDLAREPGVRVTVRFEHPADNPTIPAHNKISHRVRHEGRVLEPMPGHILHAHVTLECTSARAQFCQAPHRRSIDRLITQFRKPADLDRILENAKQIEADPTGLTRSEHLKSTPGNFGQSDTADYAVVYTLPE